MKGGEPGGGGEKNDITSAIITEQNYAINKNKQEAPRALLTVVSNSLILKDTRVHTQIQISHPNILEKSNSLTGTHVRRLMKRCVIVNIVH